MYYFKDILSLVILRLDKFDQLFEFANTPAKSAVFKE